MLTCAHHDTQLLYTVHSTHVCIIATPFALWWRCKHAPCAGTQAWGDGLLLGAALLTHVLQQEVDLALSNPLTHVKDATELHPLDGSEANAHQVHAFLQHAAHCEAVHGSVAHLLTVAGWWTGRCVRDAWPACRVEVGAVTRVYAAGNPPYE